MSDPPRSNQTQAELLTKLLTHHLVGSGHVSRDRIERVMAITQIRAAAGRPTVPLDIMAEEGLIDPQHVREIDEDIALTCLGKYAIDGVLGIGGMAVVYRSYLSVPPGGAKSSPVALKAIRPGIAIDPDMEARFRREIDVWRGLTHPNILPVRDSGEADGRLFLVMDLVEGGDLSTRLINSGPVALAESLSIMRGILRALDHAHAHGVVHRDVKPKNILLGKDVYLSDFGLAKWTEDNRAPLTATGTGMGSVGFVAPEQMQDAKRTDLRADLFSAGATWVAMLWGEDAWTALIGLRGREIVESNSIGLPPSWVDLLRRMLAPAPSERPSSAGLVLAAMDDLPPP